MKLVAVLAVFFSGTIALADETPSLFISDIGRILDCGAVLNVSADLITDKPYSYERVKGLSKEWALTAEFYGIAISSWAHINQRAKMASEYAVILSERGGLEGLFADFAGGCHPHYSILVSATVRSIHLSSFSEN